MSVFLFVLGCICCSFLCLLLLLFVIILLFSFYSFLFMLYLFVLLLLFMVVLKAADDLQFEKFLPLTRKFVGLLRNYDSFGEKKS